MPDYSIAMQNTSPQIQSPNELMANAYTLQNAKQANQLGQMKMDEYTRGLAETSQIKNALTRLDPTSPTFEQDRYNAFALQGPEGLKTLSAIKKEEAATGETALKSKGQKVSNLDAVRKFSSQSYKEVINRPSDAIINAFIEDAEENPDIPKEIVADMKRRAQRILSVPAPIDPTTDKPNYNARKEFILQMNLEAKDLMPKPSNLATLQKELSELPSNDPRRKEYEAAIRNETLNPELQSYETAVKQGFKGSIFDFKRQLAEAGRSTSTSVTKIDNFEPASVAAQKEYIKEVSATRTQLKNVKGTLDSIDKAKALVPTAKGFMGPGGEALLKATSFLNNRIGTNINVKGITDATELRTRLFGNIMENLKKLDAQPSQAQQFIMQDALGTLGTDPNAMNKVLDAYAEVLKNKVADYNTDVTDAEARGVKFPYKPQIDLGIPTKPTAPAGKNPHANKTNAQIMKELGQ
jgi:hypothetical protein